MHLLILVDVPVIGHNHVCVFHDGLGVHSGGLAVTDTACHHDEAAVLDVGAGLTRAGGQHQNLILCHHVHGIIEERAGTSRLDVVEEGHVAGKTGGPSVVAALLDAVGLVHQHHGKHLVLVLTEEGAHSQSSGGTGVIDTAQELIQAGKHLTAGHIVTVDHQHAILIPRRLQSTALVKIQRTVAVFLAVKIHLEIGVGGVLYVAIDDGIVNVQEILFRIRVIGDPAAHLVVAVVQILKRGQHMGRIVAVIHHHLRLIGVVQVDEFAFQLVVLGRDDQQVHHQIDDGHQHHQQGEQETALADFGAGGILFARDVVQEALPQRRKGIAALFGGGGRILVFVLFPVAGDQQLVQIFLTHRHRLKAIDEQMGALIGCVGIFLYQLGGRRSESLHVALIATNLVTALQAIQKFK